MLQGPPRLRPTIHEIGVFMDSVIRNHTYAKYNFFSTIEIKSKLTAVTVHSLNHSFPRRFILSSLNLSKMGPNLFDVLTLNGKINLPFELHSEVSKNLKHTFFKKGTLLLKK